MKCKFLTAFSFSGLYYPEGLIADLSPDVVEALPEGVVEVIVPPQTPPPPTPPPKASK